MNAKPQAVWLNPADLLEEEVEGEPCGVAECFLKHPRQGDALWQSGLEQFYSGKYVAQLLKNAKAEGMLEARRIMVDSLSIPAGSVAVQKKAAELKGE